MPQKVASAGATVAQSDKNFDDDRRFLEQHLRDKVFVLAAPDNPAARVMLTTFAGGSVLTSTGDGRGSHGHIDYEKVRKYAAGERDMKYSVFGGENRRWQGPEGTRFALFMPQAENQDVPISFNDWRCPPHMHIEPATLASTDNAKGIAVFRQEVRDLVNRAGTRFDLDLERTIRVLRRTDVEGALSVKIPADVTVVAHESEDKMTNVGSERWTRDKGIPVDWPLGQFDASADVTVVAPIRRGSESELGRKVTVIMGNETPDGLTIPQDRLAVGENAIYFKGDGGFRSKIGIPPRRSLGIIGAYDASANTLTLVRYTKHKGLSEKDFVDSGWDLRKDPYVGEDVFSYNDGGGGPGAFYELESMAPARELKQRETNTHKHMTIHLGGPREALDKIAKAVLGVGLDEIQDALRPADPLPEPIEARRKKGQ